MKSFVLVLLCIIAALLLIGGAVAYSYMNEMGVNMKDLDSNTIDKVKDKVIDVASSEGSPQQGGDIVSEVIKSNEQNGEGEYREVTYSDGGFRQYDRDTGELIGSSYESDQENLPSME